MKFKLDCRADQQILSRNSLTSIQASSGPMRTLASKTQCGTGLMEPIRSNVVVSNTDIQMSQLSQNEVGEDEYGYPTIQTACAARRGCSRGHSLHGGER